MNLADTRLDIRTETELFWRFRYADGEMAAVRSTWPDRIAERPGTQGFRLVERVYGTLVRHGTVDVGLRCGPVYVPSGQHGYPDYDCDLSGMRAYHLARRIDFALECTAQAHVLRLAFEAKPDGELLALCPILPRGPILANVVPLTPQAESLWRASRSGRTFRGWLARTAAKAAAGRADARLLRDLAFGAVALLASAGREYGHWRRRAA